MQDQQQALEWAQTASMAQQKPRQLTQSLKVDYFWGLTEINPCTEPIHIQPDPNSSSPFQNTTETDTPKKKKKEKRKSKSTTVLSQQNQKPKKNKTGTSVLWSMLIVPPQPEIHNQI
jgi:hypothetical protein